MHSAKGRLSETLPYKERADRDVAGKGVVGAKKRTKINKILLAIF